VPGHDGRTDGKHVEHRTQDKWQRLDADVHRSLASLSPRSVAALQALAIWPRETIFHGAPVPILDRDAWGRSMLTTLDAADVVFLDPDDGLGNTEKHAQIEELVSLHGTGRTCILIQFWRYAPGGHKLKVADLHYRLISAGLPVPETLATTAMVPTPSGAIPRCRFFTFIGADRDIQQRVKRFLQRWRDVGETGWLASEQAILPRRQPKAPASSAARSKGISGGHEPRFVTTLLNGETITVAEALTLRDARSRSRNDLDFRCPACGQSARPHRTGTTAQQAHFEHTTRNLDCPLSGASRRVQRSTPSRNR
jgi:hypothetical protein